MLLSSFNLEYPGMGVALLSVVIFMTLLFWNIYHKTQSNLSRTIFAFLITGIIYGIFSAAFYLTNGLDPKFYENIGAAYDLMLINITQLFMMVFNLVYIRRKTSKTGGAKDPMSLAIYGITAILAVAYVINAVKSAGGNPIINYLTADGIAYNERTYLMVMNLLIIIMLVPFLYIIQGWKRALPKERVILFFFALVPWLSYVVNLLVYNGAEMNVSFMAYTILGVLMVFFDQVQLDDKHAKAAARAEKLAYEAMHDKLTGLTIGSVFQSQVDGLLSDNGSEGCCFAIIDIDGFKEINSVYGRQCGDEVLKAAAKVLSEVVRVDDVTARIGGDEFAVFFKCEARYFDSLIAKIRDNLEFDYDGVNVSACIGAARVSDNDSDYEYLFTLADKALNQAKQEGTASYKLTNK